ncbi:CPBP family intramembrane metalloprotease [Tsukamurella sp. 8F]|uniref:CPBP family intramembrane glutamic endopeptidase n=1 Tax=unclassified Tsukamurella TaxID=2633480 RepID=UPI0023B9DC9B|nr:MULTISPECIES: CPBP family intramembrane glutamic endopeptidase [unclassified Tsukamurella]MDF0530687.1 CPBP family intramembrane metalloprotease [Tsukamurella sp. 8J]MDF0587888.1 CPBP family intramembrane metalloprotease [Tsukamurella sp. 8F]
MNRSGALAAFAAGAGAAVAWNNAVLPRLRRGSVGRAMATGAFGVGTAAAVRVRAHRPAGRVTTVIALAAGAAAGAWGLARVQPVTREPHTGSAARARWVLVEIPFGTALAEETLFRGALAPAACAALGPRAGALSSAAVFGLWHVGAARAADSSPAATVAATAAAGLGLWWLTVRTGRLWPAFAVHTIVNSAGALLTRSSESV